LFNNFDLSTREFSYLSTCYHARKYSSDSRFYEKAVFCIKNLPFFLRKYGQVLLDDNPKITNNLELCRYESLIKLLNFKRIERE